MPIRFWWMLVSHVGSIAPNTRLCGEVCVLSKAPLMKILISLLAVFRETATWANVFNGIDDSDVR